MRRLNRYAWLALLSVLFTACEKKNEPRKFIDPLPVSTVSSCVPGQISQAWFSLKRDVLNFVVPIVNRLSVPNSQYLELTGPSGFDYSFSISERHYGNAGVVIQFRDQDNSPIDPISNTISSATVKYVVMTVNGSSPLFTYSENLVLILETAGNVTGTKLISGQSNFSGTGNTLSFDFEQPGAHCSFEGMTDGAVNATGSGPTAATTLRLLFAPEHTANGPVSWENQTGGLHLEDNSSGYVITDEYRLLLE